MAVNVMENGVCREMCSLLDISSIVRSTSMSVEARGGASGNEAGGIGVRCWRDLYGTGEDDLLVGAETLEGVGERGRGD